MQVYIRLDDDLEKWYNALPPHGKSEAINTALRAGLQGANSATKSDIARLEALIRNLRVVQAQPQEEEYSIPSMGIEEDF